MKKLSLIVLASLFLLTGCGKNRLVCTYEESGAGFESKTTYTFTFTDEKVKKAMMKTTTTLLDDNNNKESIEAYKELAESSANDYNKEEGVSAKVSNNKNKITITIEIEAAKLSLEALNNYGLDYGKEDLTGELENMGYSCK